MRLKLVAGMVLFAGMVTVATAVAPAQRSALVRFMRPTIIAGAAVLGPVLFVHDDERMARGEPCTSVYYYDPAAKARGEKIVEFMCVPKDRPFAAKFEATLIRGLGPSGPDRLVEYQMLGEHEGHGVPDR